MKASIYFNYTTRSLLRGGQRTILAIFCVAVGVMAIVSLQLVGQMINSSFTSNIRDANGGDIAVNSQTPFKQSDLTFFDNLKSNSTITAYTPTISGTASTGLAASLTQSFTLEAVDPATFPVVTPPSFKTPANGTISNLLTNNQVVVDQNLADQYNKKVGDSFTVHARTSTGSGSVTLAVKIVGIVNDTGVFAQSNDFMLISHADYQAADPKLPLLYDTIYVTTADKAHTDKAAKAISDHFPIANTVTADQALKNNQTQVDFIKKFLEIAGLLADRKSTR